VVQDTLLEAIQVWEYKGVPDNPAAWLYKVAKNKALNIVNREKYKRDYSSEVAHFLKSEWTANAALDHLFSEEGIKDDQLRMMFTCCHPSISTDSQVALILKTLCGFSIAEIAKAFFTSEENITKRLKRARHTIRENNISFELPDTTHLAARLDAVIEAVYLLFNEGYSASQGNAVIRYELCAEAIRLAGIIAGSDIIRARSNVFAALSLMYFNASRFKSRLNAQGGILTMAEQDRSQWDPSLMQKGFHYLEMATSEESISTYHILAAISAFHCSAPDFKSTDWKNILSLYDKLLLLDHSPVTMLNRSIALSKVHGPQKAIDELLKIKEDPAIRSYHLLHSTLAEFYMELGRLREAAGHLRTAISLQPLPAEIDLLTKKLIRCEIN
jgi:RNA polymerase sigma factor (sigma-70 family)